MWPVRRRLSREGRCDGADPAQPAPRRAEAEPELSEHMHVARARATHPEGVVRWRGALILLHEGPEARTRGERACGPCESAYTARVWCGGAEPSSCCTRGLRQEPEVSEHVARAKAPHPKGEVRWRGALILPHLFGQP